MRYSLNAHEFGIPYSVDAANSLEDLKRVSPRFTHHASYSISLVLDNGHMVAISPPAPDKYLEFEIGTYVYPPHHQEHNILRNPR